MKKEVMPHKAKILLYDIETAPNLALAWGRWQQDIPKIVEQWYLLSFAYKYLGEKKTHIVGLCDSPNYKKYDGNPLNPPSDVWLTKQLHQLFSEADVLVAHNGNSFDQKMVQARMFKHGLTPPDPYLQIDTKNEAKKNFRFTGNSLNELAELLDVPTKLETGGINLWWKCMLGDKKSWKTMLKYNKNDVVILEQVYLAMRPWIKNHPSMALLEGIPNACPKCGCTDFVKKGLSITKVGYRQRYQCKGCGGPIYGRTVQKTDTLYIN